VRARELKHHNGETKRNLSETSATTFTGKIEGEKLLSQRLGKWIMNLDGSRLEKGEDAHFDPS